MDGLVKGLLQSGYGMYESLTVYQLFAAQTMSCITWVGKYEKWF